MKLAPLLAIALCCGCAESQPPEEQTVTTDTGAVATDTGVAKTDSAAPSDTITESDSFAPMDTSVDDTGSTPTSDSDFPDFSGPGGDSGGFPSPDGFSPGACTMDGECMSPFNCCEMTKMKCGIKFGTTCMTF
jgi:hypothetical protein